MSLTSKYSDSDNWCTWFVLPPHKHFEQIEIRVLYVKLTFPKPMENLHEAY